MFPFNGLSIISILVFFMFVFADDECILLCPLGSALGNGIVQGSELLWDNAVGAAGAIKDFLLPPSQPSQPNEFLPSDTPRSTDDRDPSKIDDSIHLTVVSTPDSKPPVLTDNKCDPGNPVVSTKTNLN